MGLDEQTFKSSKDIKYVFFEGNSDYLVVVFSAFNGPNAKRQHSYNYIKALSRLNINRLYILDNYGERGSYYLGELSDGLLEESVNSLILDISSNLEINKDKIILCGSSKGGSAALYYGLKYNYGHVISGAPQIFIADYLDSLDHTQSTLDYIVGVRNQKSYDELNALMLNQINENSNECEIKLFSSENDWQYKNHIVPLISKFTEKKVKHSLVMSEYPSHSEVGLYFSDYLEMTLYKLIFKSEPPKFSTEISLDQNNIYCITSVNDDEIEIAYYLVVNNEVKEKRWYSKNYNSEFQIDENRNISHKITTFARDKYGNTFYKNNIITKYEIDFNVKCSLNNNQIYCEIESTLTDIQLAYYLYVNGEKSDQIWYSDNRRVSFKTENLLINDFEVVFFMKNKKGMIYTKSIKRNTNWSLCQGVILACELLCDKDSIILEIGSGFGSVRLANICQTFCIEHDERFVNIFKNIEYIFAPIKDTLDIEEFKQNQWYDSNEIRGKLPKRIDLIIIDGPPENIGRSGILHNLDMFNSDSTWIIDDVLRTKDQKLANYIALHFKLLQYRFWNFSILTKNPIDKETLSKINSKSLEELDSKSETYMRNYYPSMFKD